MTRELKKSKCFRRNLSTIVNITLFTVISGSQKCPKNEHWVNCKLAVKTPQTCFEVNRYSIVQYRVYDIHGPCLGGCICDDGFARNDSNICIPVIECPSCGNDFNATIGDGQHCGNLCSNYRNPYVVCSGKRISFFNCSCKKGYVFNDRIARCVHPADCPKPCDGDFYATREECVDENNKPTCANPRPVNEDDCLFDGCKCIHNYVLDKPGGKCIRFDDCPGEGCLGDLNATFTNCDCGQANCISRYAQCVNGCGTGFSPGCKCKPGYIRQDSYGLCILEEDCNWG